MDVINLPNAAQEESQIVLLGESGKLRDVVEPHIHDAPDSRDLQLGEEFLGGFFGEADGEDVDGWGGHYLS
jgi:hypothetical protein